MTRTLNICHLYGNLLNTYGDHGNILMLNYLCQKMNISCKVDIVSIYETFDPEKYNLIFFGGGQDYEQQIVSNDIHLKKDALTHYIESDGVMLAICGGYQLLGKSYIGANGDEIKGIHALDHYTLSQNHNRFIGDITIYNEKFNETYVGFENHNGMTYLGEDEQPLGIVKEGFGNNGEDMTEGAIYRNVFCSYFHGPILTRNQNLATRLIELATD